MNKATAQEKQEAQRDKLAQNSHALLEALTEQLAKIDTGLKTSHRKELEENEKAIASFNVRLDGLREWKEKMVVSANASLKKLFEISKIREGTSMWAFFFVCFLAVFLSLVTYDWLLVGEDDQAETPEQAYDAGYEMGLYRLQWYLKLRLREDGLQSTEKWIEQTKTHYPQAEKWTKEDSLLAKAREDESKVRRDLARTKALEEAD